MVQLNFSAWVDELACGLQIGLQVPKCFKVESAQQLRELNSSKDKLEGKKYLLKSIPYDPAHRADLFTLPSKVPAMER